MNLAASATTFFTSGVLDLTGRSRAKWKDIPQHPSMRKNKKKKLKIFKRK